MMNQKDYEEFSELLSAIQIIADYTYEISSDTLQMEKEMDEISEHTKQVYDSAVKVRLFIEQMFILADKDKPIN